MVGLVLNERYRVSSVPLSSISNGSGSSMAVVMIPLLERWFNKLGCCLRKHLVSILMIERMVIVIA